MPRLTPPRPVHVAPEGSGDHRPSERCGCSPLYLGHDLATHAPVYRHRQPTTTAEPLRGEALADRMARYRKETRP